MKKHEDIKKDKPMMEKVAKKAVKKHEKEMHMANGGGVKIRGTGAATKGTRARGPMA